MKRKKKEKCHNSLRAAATSEKPQILIPHLDLSSPQAFFIHRKFVDLMKTTSLPSKALHFYRNIILVAHGCGNLQILKGEIIDFFSPAPYFQFP